MAGTATTKAIEVSGFPIKNRFSRACHPHESEMHQIALLESERKVVLMNLYETLLVSLAGSLFSPTGAAYNVGRGSNEKLGWRSHQRTVEQRNQLGW